MDAFANKHVFDESWLRAAEDGSLPTLAARDPRVAAIRRAARGKHAALRVGSRDSSGKGFYAPDRSFPPRCICPVGGA